MQRVQQECSAPAALRLLGGLDYRLADQAPNWRKRGRRREVESHLPRPHPPKGVKLRARAYGGEVIVSQSHLNSGLETVHHSMPYLLKFSSTFFHSTLTYIAPSRRSPNISRIAPIGIDTNPLQAPLAYTPRMGVWTRYLRSSIASFRFVCRSVVRIVQS